jgi:hypothetical protein
MIPLYEQPHFTFRFADDRIIPRFHLEGIEAGRMVMVFNIRPRHGRTTRTSGNSDRGRWRLGGPNRADHRNGRGYVYCGGGSHTHQAD